VVIHRLRPTAECLTEIWMTSDVRDAAIDVADYRLFRRDRHSGVDGVEATVAVYLPGEINCRWLFDFETERFEVTWVALEPKHAVT
jgi:hypothetical protein